MTDITASQPIDRTEVLEYSTSATGLEVEGLHVRFGGVTAVDGLDLEAPIGRITGLIGPNGAGKTTTFNACTGVVKPTAGRVRLFGRDVTDSDTADRARSGLGRTFQRMELFSSMTVAENVALGREAAYGGRNPWRLLRGSAAERRDIRAAAGESMVVCGIEHLAHHHVGSLSTGQRRMVEIARVIAGRFEVLLLDEPASGLDRSETDSLGQLLARLVEERGLGILLVEHDMDIALGVCEWLYVLDFGKLLFSGTADDVRGSELVRTAYLGDDLGSLEAGNGGEGPS